MSVVYGAGQSKRTTSVHHSNIDGRSVRATCPVGSHNAHHNPVRQASNRAGGKGCHTQLEIPVPPGLRCGRAGEGSLTSIVFSG